jgi:hypothetical protein
VFVAAVVTEIMVILIYFMDIISFLWLNVIGAIGVVIMSYILSFIFPDKGQKKGHQQMALK